MSSEGPNRVGVAKAKIISGWRAFGLEQRRKQQQGHESTDNDSEDYPSLSAPSAPQSLFSKDGDLLEKKPFSSVVVASMNFPSLKDAKQTQVPATTSCFGTADTLGADRELNYLFPWADKSLIQDVLAGVNYNFNEALSLLDAMLDKNKEAESIGDDVAIINIQGNPLGKEEEGMSLTNDPLDGSYNQFQDDASSIQLPDAAKSLPILSEPEWEEDDVYLIHRKDAIRMKRSASRFSKVANDAYMRGDHTVARYFSLKAKHEWAAAEKLNTKAAKEILNMRNCKNDVWTLDLHGLHAAEAVEALRDRLWTVESPTLDGIHKELGMLQATSQFESKRVGKQHQPSRQRTTLLQVITGKGNHSKGAAALPSAIRNFLNENGYRFDETRPGVIMIRPKFRKQ